MNEQEASYYNSGCLRSPSELQSRGKPGHIQGCKETEEKVALGILCLLLLVAIAVWLAQILVFRPCQEKHHQEILNNLSNEYHIMQNVLDLKEEMLKNKSMEYEKLKALMESSGHYWKNRMILNCLHHTGKTSEGHGICCGPKCYHFIVDTKTWDRCKQICQTCHLSLLKLNDVEEQNFFQPKLSPHRYWIGLFYDKENNWQWIDNGTPGLHLNLMNSQPRGKQCAVFSSTRIENDDCNVPHSCICEQKMDQFSNSPCK